jgi:hypothetical protein
MPKSKQAPKAYSRTAHTIFTVVFVVLSGFYMLPAGIGAIRNKRYLGTLFMLNVGAGFLIPTSFSLFVAAWGALLVWSLMADPGVRRPLY